MLITNKKTFFICSVILIFNPQATYSSEMIKSTATNLSKSLDKKHLIPFLGILALTTYAIKKYNNNKKLNDLSAQENKYFQENIKITKDTIFAFDINDVIIQADFTKIWDIIKTKILKQHKLDLLKAFIKPYLYYIVFKEIVKGGVPEQILETIKKAYPQFSDLTYIGLELANAQKEVNGMFGLIGKLNDQKFKLVLNSNVGQDKFNAKESSIEMLNRYFSIFKYFDLDKSILTTQQDNYLKKPNPKFFAKFLNKFSDSEREKIVFIDDRIKNVIAARKAGIKSILFRNAQDLAQKLGLASEQHSIA